MKLTSVAILAALFLLPELAYAGTAIYSLQTTSVTSTTPVSVMPVASRAHYSCKVPAGSTTGPVVYCEPYTGAAGVPSSTPSNRIPYAAGESVWDDVGDLTLAPSYQSLGEGLACALVSGSTAVEVDCQWR